MAYRNGRVTWSRALKGQYA